MSASAAAVTGEAASPALQAFTAAVADDVTLLADLHDREPSAEVVAAVRACPVADEFGLTLTSDAARHAFAALTAAAAQLPAAVDQRVVDELAAAYADVYLRHTYRTSPSESVWLTEDGLERQAPMFRVRDVYRRHGLKVTDSANRPDDHLVLQLRFLAHVFGRAATPQDLAPAAEFLDAHLLRWIDRFAARLVEARAPDWFAAVALLTAAYLQELRDHLAALTGLPRPKPETKPAAFEISSDAAPAAYVPGIAPSW